MNNYKINKWTYILMDAVLLYEPFMRDNTLIIANENQKLIVVKDIFYGDTIKKMFADYIKEYARIFPKIYIVVDYESKNTRKYKYNFLPFFYLSVNIYDLNYRFIIPDYDLPEITDYKKTKDVFIVGESNPKNKNKKKSCKSADIAHSRILQTAEYYSPFNFVRLFSFENAIVKILHPKKEWLLLDQMFIPGVDYIISDDMTNYVSGSGINKYKNLTNKNILRILDEVLCPYIKMMATCKQQRVYYLSTKFIGGIIGHGLQGKIYNIKNDPDKVLKTAVLNPGRTETLYEAIVSCIISDNPLFLKLYMIYYIKNTVYLIIERADYNLHEYYNKYGISKKIWKKIHDEIYAGMMELHRLNILHNDILPKNIMYSVKRDKFFLIDFGMSRWITPENKDKDFIMFSGIPNVLRIPEVLARHSMTELIAIIPKNIYTERYKLDRRNKLSEKECNESMQFFAAMYFINLNNLYSDTYPNKLFAI